MELLPLTPLYLVIIEAYLYRGTAQKGALCIPYKRQNSIYITETYINIE